MGVERLRWGDRSVEVEMSLGGVPAPVELVTTGFTLAFDGDCLLLVRLADRDWHPPGGHREAQETPKQAAVREAMEEAGCEVAQLAPLGWQRVTSHDPVPPGWRYPVPTAYQQFFVGRVDGSRTRAGAEAVDAALFPPERARRLDWVRRHEALYEEALRRAAAPAQERDNGEVMAADEPHGAHVAVVRRSASGPLFLCLHRTGGPAAGDWAWGAPGGARYPGEDPADTAARELLEEAGLRADLAPLPGSPPNWCDFVVEVAGVKPTLSDEHDAFRWLTTEEACALCRPPGVAAIFPVAAQWLEGRRIPGLSR